MMAARVKELHRIAEPIGLPKGEVSRGTFGPTAFRAAHLAFKPTECCNGGQDDIDDRS
jgi:hypothetical protein